jgi:adenylate kinase
MTGRHAPNVAIVLGPPGAGKTTLAIRVCEALDLRHLSSGDLLRALSAGHGALADRLRLDLAAGRPPDDVARDAVLARLSVANEAVRDVLLDGFPRTPGQACALDAHLAAHGRSVVALLYLAVSHETAVARLGRRRVCPACGPIAGRRDEEPPDEDTCGACGSRVGRRWGDTDPGVLSQRRAVFFQDSGAVLAHYRERGRLITVDAERTMDEASTEAGRALARVLGGRTS